MWFFVGNACGWMLPTRIVVRECNMDRKQEIKERIRRLNELPTLPSCFNNIVDTIEDDWSSVADLSNIISQDQALASKILRLSYSAYSGRFRDVSTIEQAVIVV